MSTTRQQTCQQLVNKHVKHIAVTMSVVYMPGKFLWYKCDRAGGCAITGYHVLVVFPPWLQVRLQDNIPALLLRYSCQDWTHVTHNTWNTTLHTESWSVIEMQRDRCQQWKPTTWIAIILSAKKSCLTTIKNSPIFTLAPKALSLTRYTRYSILQ